MQHRYTVSILLLFLSLSINAQVFSPPGAKWHFKTRDMLFSGPESIIEYVYTSDEMKSGRNCQRIVVNQKTYWPGNPVPVAQDSFRTYHTYVDNGVIFKHNGNGFDTIVNLLAKIGDKWLDKNCNKPFTVTDTGHIVLQNFTLKTVSVVFTDVTKTYTTTFTERLGFGCGTMGDQIFVSNCNRDNMTDGGYCTFLCYGDNSFGLYKPAATECDKIIGITERSYDRLNVFPNPSSDMITISLSSGTAGAVALFDVHGQKVTAHYIIWHDTLRLDVSALESGLYVLEFCSAGTGNVSRGRIIVN